jgi:predicted  nucleic acid-binding Zn-ribbon protein
MADPCIKEDRVSRLEDDVKIINERLNRHSGKIDKISDNNLVLETILKRLEEDSVLMKQNNIEVNKTMVSIQTAMTEITYNVKELNTRLNNTDTKMSESCKKLEEVEGRGKFDLITFLVSVGVPALLVLGFGTYITSLVK